MQAAPEVLEIPKTVEAYDTQIIEEKVKPFIKLSNEFGSASLTELVRPSLCTSVQPSWAQALAWTRLMEMLIGVPSTGRIVREAVHCPPHVPPNRCEVPEA